MKSEKRELARRDAPLGWRSLTVNEIHDLKADNLVSVFGDCGIETRVFRCLREGFVWTRKPNSSAVFYKTVPENVVTVDPDRSEIHELTGYDS